MKTQEKSSSRKVKSSSLILGALKLCEKSKRRNGFDCSGPSCSTPIRSWMEDVIIKGKPLSLQLSARKLASVVWEFQNFVSSSSSVNNRTRDMYLGVNNHGNVVDNQRVLGHRQRVDKDEGFDPQSHVIPGHHPASAGSLRRHIAASLMRHHKSSEKNKQAFQPLSPASYGSSLEMAPYNPAASPDSSIELRKRIGESNYRFKTSSELLKVLNRIWSLEEQHTSNTSLVKGLKTELHHARSRIKELLRDQQANRHEIDQLMKKISEDGFSRKSKDHDRIDAALQSARDELEDERKLRKRSESLHRKLARELFEVKVALATSVKEIEKEKNSSEVLEELCDEFAKGIKEYAKQAHAAKQKHDKDWTHMTDHDNLTLHMSESWLDERIQKKDMETQGITSQRQPVVDKLRHEIESFLATRQLADPKDTRLRRCSLESIPEAVTAPQDSAFSDLHGEEVSKAGPSNYEDEEENALRVRRKGQSLSQSPSNGIYPGIMKNSGETSTEVNMLQKSDIYDSLKEQRKKGYDEKEGHESNSKTVDKLISELLVSEGGNVPSKYEYKEVASSNPTIRRNASPTRQWMTSMASPDPRSSEASSKVKSVKDNTLKARLLEPKLKGQRSQLKILKGSS